MNDTEVVRDNKYIENISNSLVGKLSILANIIGAAGLYGVIKFLLDTIRPPGGSESPVSNYVLAVFVSIIGLLLLILSVLYTEGRLKDAKAKELAIEIKKQRENYGDLLQEKQKQLDDLERVQIDRDHRFAQKRAVDAAIPVYGYELAKIAYHYTVYRRDDATDGEAKAQQQVSFVAGRRTIKDWWRTIGCTLVDQSEFKLPQARVVSSADSFRVDVIRKKIDSHKSSEQYVFTPSIEKKHGVVTLHFDNPLPPGTLKTRRKEGVPEEEQYDFIAFSPREPVSRLELTVEFDGFSPTPSADAIYGPASRPQGRETVDANESLSISKIGSKRTAKLTIDYPIMGVMYRLKWSLDDAYEIETTEHAGPVVE